MKNKAAYLLLFITILMFPTSLIWANNDKLKLSSLMEDKDIAVLRSIDKLYARTSTFEVPVGQTVKFGNSLFIRPQACRKTPVTKQPEMAAFLQVWETPEIIDDNDNKNTQIEIKSHWVFSGWVFASSPALSAMDHPVFDVWLIDCKNSSTIDKETLDKSPSKDSE